MLDQFCSSLSDEAQLKIALRLGKLTLPVWQRFFTDNPGIIERVNQIVGEENRVKGGSEKINIAFPALALEEIERSYQAAKIIGGFPIPIMKADRALAPLLTTIMQPLTNPEWDHVLPHSVKLVYTHLFNMLSWIRLKRKTPDNETHIYVAINQAADVLMRESICSTEQINRILSEYNTETRQGGEDEAWEQTPAWSYDTKAATSHGSDVAKEVLRQMREEGKSYHNDMVDEYVTGESVSYQYEKEQQTFLRTEFDTVVGSYYNKIPMSEAEMLAFVSGLSLGDLKESGFNV